MAIFRHSMKENGWSWASPVKGRYSSQLQQEVEFFNRNVSILYFTFYILYFMTAELWYFQFMDVLDFLHKVAGR